MNEEVIDENVIDAEVVEGGDSEDSQETIEVAMPVEEQNKEE